MENNLSFSEFIKNEIMEHNWTDEQWRVLFYIFLRTNGTYKRGSYIVTTTLKKWEEKFTLLFKKFYKIDVKPIFFKKIVKYEIKDTEFLEHFSRELGTLIANNLEEIKAYVAGIFVGKGWISNPSSKFYHFEVRVRHLQLSLDVQEAFDSFGIRTHTINKNGWYYTYVKKSSEISKIISAFNAPQSVMYFEDSRIERDFISSFKKMESIEEYNHKKQHELAKTQIGIINKIKDKKICDTLTKNQKMLMNLRLEKPEYSLSELQMELNYRLELNISKSTINNWLKKILSLEEMTGDK